MLGDQLLLVRALRLARLAARSGQLQLDEVAARVSSLEQRVGQDQSRCVVEGLVVDAAEERLDAEPLLLPACGRLRRSEQLCAGGFFRLFERRRRITLGDLRRCLAAAPGQPRPERGVGIVDGRLVLLGELLQARAHAVVAAGHQQRTHCAPEGSGRVAFEASRRHVHEAQEPARGARIRGPLAQPQRALAGAVDVEQREPLHQPR